MVVLTTVQSVINYVEILAKHEHFPLENNISHKTERQTRVQWGLEIKMEINQEASLCESKLLQTGTHH